MVIATTGFFDGVHTGHRKVIETLCRTAKERGAQSVAVTFWPHPRNVLRQDAQQLRLLSSLKEKEELLRDCGVDRVEVVDFTREFSTMSCEEFLKDYIIGELGASALIVGYDHHLGNPEYSTDIRSVAAGLGLETIEAPSVSDAYNTVSSTYIRRLLEQGEMQEAMRFLGHPHCLSGEVVHGRQLGRTIGVPTANLLIPEGVLTPAFGVYATKVILPDGSEKLAVTNVGVRPTVGESNLVTVEPWILDFEGDLYGQHIRVDFYQRLRGEKRFDGLTALQQEIFANAEETRALLG